MITPVSNENNWEANKQKNQSQSLFFQTVHGFLSPSNSSEPDENHKTPNRVQSGMWTFFSVWNLRVSVTSLLRIRI